MHKTVYKCQKGLLCPPCAREALDEGKKTVKLTKRELDARFIPEANVTKKNRP